MVPVQLPLSRNVSPDTGATGTAKDNGVNKCEKCLSRVGTKILQAGRNTLPVPVCGATVKFLCNTPLTPLVLC